MIAWWTALSWSHAALIALVILIALGAILLLALEPRDKAREDDRSPWPLVDYSGDYQKKAAWLGDRHLLAKPINRRAS